MTGLRNRLGTAIRFHRRIGRVGLRLSSVVLSLQTACAQSSDEVLVLVNRNSPDSIAIANTFVQAREIPPVNVVELDLPPEALSFDAKVSADQFRDWIWNPANAAIVERGLRDHVWAWIYSAGFPLRCDGPPGMSLTGITFSKGEIPDPGAVQSGRAFSALFAGPVQPDGPASDTTSPVWAVAKLGANTPVPSMVLGHTGARGTSLGTALDVVRRGVAADFSHPAKSEVFYVTGKDVRSTCRAWQFPAAAEQIGRETTSLPTKAKSVLGVQCGRPGLSEITNYNFVPGAMAEHLTSFAGAFWVFHQTKLSYWLRKGATASCGTVVEPLAIWTKFPHARFYEHYAHGTSMLESFYLSVASPFQLLIMGEPLARPFADPLAAHWAPDNPAQPHTYRVEVPDREHQTLCRFLLNGRPLALLSPAMSVTLKPSELAQGVHELRAVISSVSPVRRHTQLLRTITIGEERVRLTADPSVPLDRFLPLHVESTSPISALRILKGATELAAWEGGDDIRIDARRLGRGPSPLHAEATLTDGQTTRSETVWVEVSAPIDPIAPIQLADYRKIPKSAIPDTALAGQAVKYKWGNLSVLPGKKKTAIILIEGSPSNRLNAITATLGWEAKLGVPEAHTAGIVFNYRTPVRYDFFGMHRGVGWALLSRNGKNTTIHAQRGTPISFGEDYPLELEVRQPHGIVGRVEGQVVLEWEEGKIRAGPIGLIASERHATRFTELRMR